MLIEELLLPSAPSHGGLYTVRDSTCTAPDKQSWRLWMEQPGGLSTNEGTRGLLDTSRVVLPILCRTKQSNHSTGEECASRGGVWVVGSIEPTPVPPHGTYRFRHTSTMHAL